MKAKKSKQKLISFTENSPEMAKVSRDIRNGWSIVNLVRNGNYYIGIMEPSSNSKVDEDGNPIITIPPRKKIKLV